MNDREATIVELETRVKSACASWLKYYKRTPTSSPPKGTFPALFLLEGVDPIVSESRRTWSGYPVKRELELTFELWCKEDDDTKGKIKAVRGAVFSAPIPPAIGSIVRELRSYGPFNSSIPGVEAMQLVLMVKYTDEGPEKTI